MAMIRNKPFEAQRLEEEREKDKSRTLTLRLNKADDEVLKMLKKALDVPSDGSVIRLCMVIEKCIIGKIIKVLKKGL